VFIRTDSLDFTSTSSMDFSGLIWAADATANRQTLPDYARSRLKSSDLHIVDVDTGAVTVLAKAMGFATPGDFSRNVSYLPFGDNDTHHNYYPTISPVAAGGYFWIFFDSVRNYGNLGIGRQLWGTAIDIRPNGGYVTDPSHPPFYVEGQEFTTTNHRAFAALEVCRPNAEACSSGIDCCTGFCANDRCAPPPTTGCAQRDERCASTSDCCVSSDYCINGFCALVELL
jgi:hypothetical protein